jgi:uncharacterized protein
MEKTMKTLNLFVKQHSLLIFFFLAFALSWWLWIFYPGRHIRIPVPLLPCGPSLAALLVAAITGGKTSLKSLLSRLIRWRVGISWYLIALIVPFAIYFVAALLNILFGAHPTVTDQLKHWYYVFLLWPINLLNPLSGAMGEELGWRGFGLPRLQERYSAFVSSIVIGAVQTLWHLPLFFINVLHTQDIILYMGITFFVTWIFNNTNGSVLLAMLFHASFNTVATFGSMFSASDLTRMLEILGTLWFGLAIIIVVVTRPSMMRRINSVSSSA